MGKSTIVIFAFLGAMIVWGLLEFDTEKPKAEVLVKPDTALMVIHGYGKDFPQIFGEGKHLIPLDRETEEISVTELRDISGTFWVDTIDRHGFFVNQDKPLSYLEVCRQLKKGNASFPVLKKYLVELAFVLPEAEKLSGLLKHVQDQCTTYGWCNNTKQIIVRRYSSPSSTVVVYARSLMDWLSNRIGQIACGIFRSEFERFQSGELSKEDCQNLIRKEMIESHFLRDFKIEFQEP